jgi:hypothetical protein
LTFQPFGAFKGSLKSVPMILSMTKPAKKTATKTPAAKGGTTR